jgi:hypothetical protein
MANANPKVLSELQFLEPIMTNLPSSGAGRDDHQTSWPRMINNMGDRSVRPHVILSQTQVFVHLDVEQGVVRLRTRRLPPCGLPRGKTLHVGVPIVPRKSDDGRLVAVISRSP